MSTPPTNELERVGLEAARDARREVASLIQAVADEHPELGKTLSGVVASLFSAEVGDAQKIHDCLERASEGLRRLLDDERWVTREAIARGLSRSLAMVHPARTALARELGKDRRTSDGTEPFLLTSARVKTSDPPPGAERRDAWRAELEVDVGFEGDNRFYAGTTGDISRGGLFVATDTPLMVGTELTLSFVLPDAYRIATDATVTWVRAPRYRPDELPAGMGVRFDDLSTADRGALEHYLRDRPPFRYGD